MLSAAPGTARTTAGIDIEAVSRIVREAAAEVIMPRWRNLAAHEIGSKSSPGDIVTIADREAEAYLSRRLSALLPGSCVVGEEAVHADPAVLDLLRSGEPAWVVDPIDGTRRFAEGKTAFDVMVALVIGGHAVAGWIYAPAEGRMLMGEAGGGVVIEADGEPARPIGRPWRRQLRDLNGIVTARGIVNRGYADPTSVQHLFRGFSAHTCAGHNYARLLTAESDFLINFATLPWDHMAGLALAQEAGFHAARLDGQPFDALDPKGGILVAPSSDSWLEILATLLRRP